MQYHAEGVLCMWQGELDELEREEFFRLKKVQAKKKRDAAITDALVSLPFMRLCCGDCPTFLPELSTHLACLCRWWQSTPQHQDTQQVCRPGV